MEPGGLNGPRIAPHRPRPAMALVPYEQVDDVVFTIRPPELAARFGPPLAQARNEVGLDEWDYGERVFRFQDSGRLEEVTQRAAVVHFGGLAVPFSALRGFVAMQDREFFERAGYVVSPRFGLAFVPGEPPWVTALARHCIDTWRALPPGPAATDPPPIPTP